MYHFIEMQTKQGEDFHTEFFKKWKEAMDNKKWKDPREVRNLYGSPRAPSDRADAHKDYD